VENSFNWVIEAYPQSQGRGPRNLRFDRTSGDMGIDRVICYTSEYKLWRKRPQSFSPLWLSSALRSDGGI